MKKTLNKVVAVVLTLAMLLSIASVPISADTLNSLADDNTNGKTIDITGIVSSKSSGANPITSAKAGDTFYLVVNFSDNPTELPLSMCVYTLLFGYNPDKIQIVKKLNRDTNPTFNAAYNEEGVFLATWASEAGIEGDDGILSEGTLFVVQATALKDLTEDDLAKIKLIDKASTVNSEGEQVTAETEINDLDNGKFAINWVPTLEEGPVAIEIKDTDFTFDLTDKEYTGSAIEPTVTSTLTEGTDYEVTYSNNVEVGTATITVTGKGNYTGKVEKTFKIVAKEVSGDNTNGKTIDVSAIISSKSSGANPITSAKAGDTFYLVVNFSDNPTELPLSMCVYTLLFGYNPDKIQIVKKLNRDTNPTFNAAYNEEGVFLATWASEAGIEGDDGILSEGTLFVVQATALKDLTEDDLAKIKLIDKASTVNSEGEQVTAETEINDLDNGKFAINWVPTLEEAPEATVLNDSDFTVKAEKTYTGLEIDADIDTALTAGTDYEVSYSKDRVNVGPVTVTITGKGNYTGTVEKTFNIVAKALTDSDFTVTAEKTYTGSEIDADIDTALTAGTDFEVSYSKDRTNVGPVTVTFTGKGNYKDTVTKTFKIVEKDINDLAADTFEFDLANKTYTGSAFDGLVTSAKLSAGTDYEVSYSKDRVNVGPVTITVTGKGNYKGEIVKNFNIVAKTIEDSDFEFDLADKEYAGSAITPKVTPLTGLKEGTDYTVAYSNNDKVGTATITVEGCDNCTGTITKTFKIIDKSTLDDINLIISFTEAKENGEKITSVASGEKFWIWVDFANNFTEADKTAIAYEMLVAYDPKKVQLDDYYKGLTEPIGNLKFNDRTAFLSWADTAGIKSGMPAQVQSEGNLFVIEATAKDVLSTRDLLGITIADEAMGVAGGVTRDKKTVFHNISENVIDYLVLYTIDEGALIKASDFKIDTSDKEYIGAKITPSVTSETLRKGVDYIVEYYYNENVGDAIIVIKGFGDYVGTIQRRFRINPKPITASQFSFDTSTRIYSGSKFEPTVTSTLPSDAYEVSYANNLLVGTATITVNGIGNYTGVVTKYFTIVAKEITDADFEFDLADKEYTGSAIEPKVESALKAGIDYKVAYSSNIEVGTATLVVTAEGNYKGTITKTFKVVPRAIQEIDFNFDLDNKVYTGSAIIPEVTAATGLVEGRDYEVKYENNVEFGKATITVTGKGNYTSTVVKNFNIVARDIEDSDFTFDLTDKAYTGEEIKPVVTSTLADTDYEVSYDKNIEKGTATITVRGKGNYAGAISKTFQIITREISEADFKFDLVNKVYTGEEIKPAVTSTLKAGTDYTVTYANNINVGTATITVTGSGENCAGTVSKEFEIVAKTLTEADFVFDLADEVYTSKAIEDKVTSELKAGVDYDVTYENNVNVGTATIIVVGKDNYAGRVVKTFDITTRTLKDGDFTIDDADKVYTGSAIEPEVTSTLADGDFEVAYTENVNAGTATITVTGIGNCAGEIVKTFTITKKPITDDDFVFDLVNKPATGSEIEPEVTSTLADGDYVVEYSNNVEAGTATITVTATGDNCEGEIVKTFKIVAESIADAEFTFDEADKEYTGSEIKPEVTSNLVAGTDYEVTYENNVEVGTATIIVNGIGDTFGGTIKKTFVITAKAIDATDFTFDLADQVYTGSVIEPEVKSILATDDYVVTYENNVNVGTATIKVTGKGNYSGEVTETFAITAKAIDPADFTFDLADKKYTGSAIEPKVTSTLAAGTDYEVTYKDNVNVGTATITVTGKGNNCSGTISETFKIVARVIDIADFTIDTADKVYTGSAIEPTVTSTLVAGKDYVVTYENNKEIGTATITITGKGPNCKGVISTTFKIVEKYAPAGGSGGGFSSYTITTGKADSGKVTASRNTAKEGQEVIVTVTPDAGYVLSTLVIVDKKGNEVAVTKDGANYKFVMPASGVEIKAIFVEDAGEDDGFTDVKPGAYYYDAVNWAVENGITNGMSASSFGTNFDCTRAQMVTFLWRAAGCPAPKATECDFVDLVKGSYYYDAVLWAAENGITIGTSATTFSPDDNVTRGQTVTFFWRMENKPAAEVNVEFTDVAADAYYYDAVAWAVEEEITNGVSATSFAPNDMCKREQIVTFLYRFFVK